MPEATNTAHHPNDTKHDRNGFGNGNLLKMINKYNNITKHVIVLIVIPGKGKIEP